MTSGQINEQTRVKILSALTDSKLEGKINAFLSRKDVIVADVRFEAGFLKRYAIILYEMKPSYTADQFKNI